MLYERLVPRYTAGDKDEVRDEGPIKDMPKQGLFDLAYVHHLESEVRRLADREKRHGRTMADLDIMLAAQERLMNRVRAHRRTHTSRGGPLMGAIGGAPNDE